MKDVKDGQIYTIRDARGFVSGHMLNTDIYKAIGPTFRIESTDTDRVFAVKNMTTGKMVFASSMGLSALLNRTELREYFDLYIGVHPLQDESLITKVERVDEALKMARATVAMLEKLKGDLNG